MAGLLEATVSPIAATLVMYYKRPVGNPPTFAIIKPLLNTGPHQSRRVDAANARR